MTVAGVRYDTSALSPDEQAAWQRHLNAIERSCGCGVGSAAGIVGVALYVLWLRSGATVGTGEPWIAWVWGSVVFLLAGLAGKTLAMQVARSRRRRLVAAFMTRLEVASATRDSAF